MRSLPRGYSRFSLPGRTARACSLFSLVLLLLSGSAHAVDIENARRINKTCSLCHGMYGQGTPGMMSPRLAGLPADYLIKEMKLYRDGTREYAPMAVTSSVDTMTDKDIEDIAYYMAGVDLRTHGLPDVPAHDGDDSAGRKLYKRECRTCHSRDGHGKPRKGVPPLAGQYGSYLLNQMHRFRKQDRYHADDPEDDLFNEFKDDQLNDVIAYVTRLAPNTVLAPVDDRLEAVVDMGSMAAAMAGMGAPIVLAESTPLDPSLSDGVGEAGQRETQLVGTTRENSAGGFGGSFTGQFRVTPDGEIVLSMKDMDTRAISGLRGVFRVSSEGSLAFFPHTTPAKTFRY